MRMLASAGLDGKSTGKLLEVGCHVGVTALAVSKFCPLLEIAGMDFSSESMRVCRGTDSIWWVQGDCANMPFADGAFEFATCLDLTEHLPRSQFDRLREELARVLASGGLLILKQGTWKDGNPEHINIMREDELVEAFRNVGFWPEGALQSAGRKGVHHLLRRA